MKLFEKMDTFMVLDYLAHVETAVDPRFAFFVEKHKFLLFARESSVQAGPKTARYGLIPREDELLVLLDVLA